MKARILFAVALFFLATGVALAAASANLDQCADLVKGVHVPCSGSQWQNGNLNTNNSDYTEGQSNPYLALLTGMTPGQTVSVTIQYAFTTQNDHAHDYLTSWDRNETGDLCSVQACPPGTFTTTLPIPLDPILPSCGFNPPVVQVPGVFTGVNITLISASYVGTHACEGTSIDVTVAVTFTVGSPDGMLAWGGHIARQTDWGIGKTASSLTGSPYHMRLLEWTYGNIGNQDRSMQLAAPTAVRLTSFGGIPDVPQERARLLIVLGLVVFAGVVIWTARR